MGEVSGDARPVTISWVVLTMGDRPAAVDRARASLAPRDVVVVQNGPAPGGRTEVADVELADNVGVPAGRHRGLQATRSDVVGFLDDDAELRGDVDRIAAAFAADPDLGAVALRLVDEDGLTARRHVPRAGGRHPERPGRVALFLGGASAIRRRAYDDVGGYFGDLFYGHEEVELCWRLVDAGWEILYLPEVEVFHPRTEIERHADGWELTGRNRVLIARRTLPWPIAIAHVVGWLVVGVWRAPRGDSRRRYLAGWRDGWSHDVDRAPISWRGVWRLTRLGRPPVV